LKIIEPTEIQYSGRMHAVVLTLNLVPRVLILATCRGKILGMRLFDALFWFVLKNRCKKWEDCRREDFHHYNTEKLYKNIGFAAFTSERECLQITQKQD
jgi:hypothetical protein